MGDMMPDDIPHTDDKAKRKIHPRAKDCFVISLVRAALIGCFLGILFLDDVFPGNEIFIYGKLIAGLLLIVVPAQPLGILLGIYSLVQIRKNSSYYGKVYAIAGITISTTSIIMIGMILFG